MMGFLRSFGSTSLLISIMLSIILMSYSLTSAASFAERSTCKDTSPNCEKWAIEGMCRQDPDMEAFMGRRCPFACDVCGARGKRRGRAIAELSLDAAAADHIEADKRSCEDFSPKCETFATDGLCTHSETSSLMAKTCPYTCDGCKREENEEKKMEEEEKEEVEEEEEEEKKDAVEEEAAREVSRREVRVAMKEEREREARFFASLISDAASADDAVAAAAAAEVGVERRSCRDFSPKCDSYATNGLCRHRETSSLMAKTCPSSCGKCVKRGVESEIENVPVREKRAICKDNKAKCETWATHGMCKSDPDMAHFMAKTCPFACDMC